MLKQVRKIIYMNSVHFVEKDREDLVDLLEKMLHIIPEERISGK